MRSIWVAKQGKREAISSCHPDHIREELFAIAKGSFYMCSKIREDPHLKEASLSNDIPFPRF